MRKVILCCILTLLFALPLSNRASAQKINDVVIEGRADFAKGEEIRLVIFDDLLTYTPKTVATAKIAKNGQFSLKYKATQITLAQLVIRTSRAEFLVSYGIDDYVLTAIALSVQAAAPTVTLNGRTYDNWTNVATCVSEVHPMNCMTNAVRRPFSFTGEVVAHSEKEYFILKDKTGFTGIHFAAAARVWLHQDDAAAHIVKPLDDGPFHGFRHRRSQRHAGSTGS